MKRAVTLLSFFLISLAAGAQQTNGQSSGYCYVGAVSAIIQGLPSSNKLLGVIPSCKITVYYTGTQNLAQIFDGSGTQLPNPFTATTLGYWNFYAPNNAKYDVIGSGGNPPNVYPTPTVLIVSGGTGGGGSSGPPLSVQFASNNSGNFGSDPNITIDPINHLFKVAGAGTGKIGLCGLTSGNCFLQQADPSTQPWTLTWPQYGPGAGVNCLTAVSSGAASWQPCLSTSFMPIAGGAFTGPVTGPSAVFQTTNGEVNAAVNPIAGDIGAKINNSLTACSSQCAIKVPAGNYTFTTPIVLQLNVFNLFSLEFAKGAVLRYNGTGDAILFPVSGAGPTAGNCEVSGGFLIGNASATSGVHVQPTNTCNIHGMTITQFTGGAGVWLDGANSVNVDHNYITNNNVGVYETNTWCSGTTCGPSPSFGLSFTPNANHVDHDTITGNAIGMQFFDVNTSGNTGALDDSVSHNNMEMNTLAISAGRSTGLVVGPANYFESSGSIVTQFGIPGGGDASSRFFASQGLVVRDNYFTISAGQTQVNLLDTSDALIEGNSTVVGGQNSSNCFINTLANNGTNIGETGTRIGKNHVLLTGGGAYTCIGGVGQPLVGAGSYIEMNPNYLSQIANQTFQANTAVTSETIAVQNLTLGGSCQLHPIAGNSTGINNGRSTLLAGTTYLSGITTNQVTITHPSGQAIFVDLYCTYGPLSGFGIP